MARLYVIEGNVLKPMVNDIAARRKLKEAKTHKKNLEVILKVVDLTSAGLARYEVYRTASNILNTLKNEKVFLVLGISECNKIIEKKGYL